MSYEDKKIYKRLKALKYEHISYNLIDYLEGTDPDIIKEDGYLEQVVEEFHRENQDELNLGNQIEPMGGLE